MAKQITAIDKTDIITLIETHKLYNRIQNNCGNTSKQNNDLC